MTIFPQDLHVIIDTEFWNWYNPRLPVHLDLALNALRMTQCAMNHGLPGDYPGGTHGWLVARQRYIMAYSLQLYRNQTQT